jgi:gliding motility-associated-like protein
MNTKFIYITVLVTVFIVAIQPLRGELMLRCVNGDVAIVGNEDEFSQFHGDSVVIITPAGDTLSVVTDITMVNNHTFLLVVPITTQTGLGVYRFLFITHYDGTDSEVSLFFGGCWTPPSCGQSFSSEELDQPREVHRTTVLTDTISTIRLDILAYDITDTLEVFFGLNSVLKIAIGGLNRLTGGPLGPFVWQDGHITSYRQDSLFLFPYFYDLGIEMEFPLYDGLAVFLLTIPDSVCTVHIDLWGNVDERTVWNAFLHCSPRSEKPSFIETIYSVHCEQGYITYAFDRPPLYMTQDTMIRVLTYTEGGCTLEKQYVITIVASPLLDVAIDDLTCDHQEIFLDVISYDDRPLRLLLESDGFLLESFANTRDIDITNIINDSRRYRSAYHSFHLPIEVQGCVHIFVIPYTRWSCEIYLPTAFSPNDDGVNDSFYPMTNIGVEGLSIHQMIIVDRWGNIILQKNNVHLNTPADGWDGTYRGEPVEPGVYVWTLHVLYPDGEFRRLSGDVTVVR